MMSFSYEKRSLKRPRLGPPDVYPQEPKQKEDELTTSNVKHGFATMPQLTDEFGTARNCNITASKIASYFSGIIGKKEELNTLPDSGRKRQQINPKDNFWPATARTKNAIEAWFKDLAGSKPLLSLSKKAPNFNKKEEIFLLLCEYQVPMLRAAWFIKLSSAYTVAVSEAKIKKRQLPDPTQEWTGTLLKFLKDQLAKLQDHYTSSSTAPMLDEQKIALRQWRYTLNLMKSLYEEGLLDRQEVLQWILDLLEKARSSAAATEDGVFRLVLPLALQYLDEFVQSELLARKLSYLASRKLSTLCWGDLGSSPANPPPPSTTISGTSANSSTANSTLQEYLNCPHHRDIVLGLSSIIQVVTLECPTALVWNCIGEGKSSSVLNGSPLDVLPCSPASLPMPQRTSNPHIRNQLRLGEELIRQRSLAAEAKWSCDKWQQSSAGVTTNKVLTALDALDRHSFERIDASNSLDTLYAKIFFTPPGGSTGKEAKDSPSSAAGGSTDDAGRGGERYDYGVSQDEALVEILCEWAVSGERWGEHRAMAVAKLLERRQSEVLAAAPQNGGTTPHNGGGTTPHNGGGASGGGDSSGVADCDKDSVASGGYSGTSSLPVYQSLLMRFLDHDAPVLDENPSPSERTKFTNLVHLFAELIRHDVFSHDAYMCTLISRGDLLTVTNPTGPGTGNTTPHPGSNKPGGGDTTPGGAHVGHSALDDDSSLFDLKPDHHHHGARGGPPPGVATDYDESKIDDDLEKLLQHIKEEQQNSMDAPDSPKDEPGSLVGGGGGGAGGSSGGGSSGHDGGGHDGGVGVGAGDSLGKGRPSRHLLYTTHFPLPQDESSNHDCNQRHVLLYGVGRIRDEARHVVKRISKDICKLFSKKFSIDVAEGGKVKKHSRNEFNFEATTSKVQSLSYFDQHVVTWQCSVTVIEMINSFASGNSNYLPVQEHVAFLFDLMELAVNIDGLIDVCIQILKEVPEVEAQLVSKGSSLARSYTPSLVLYVVGVLRRYHCSLLLFPEQTIAVFEGLCRVVKHVSNPGDCCSVERCVLSHLYDLYSRCWLLKARPHGGEPFSNAYPKIRAALYTSLQPQPSNHTANQFMADVILALRRGVNMTQKMEPAWSRGLNESGTNRYGFVVNTVLAVCAETDLDRLNDLGHLAAELTACCSSLSIEWLGVLMALCCSSSHPSYFMDVLRQVDIHDVATHNSLGVFTSILIARHCFSLEDFVVRVALPSLLNVFNEGRVDADVDAEAGARLTCHLLLRLFKTIEIPQPALYSVGTSPHPVPSNSAAASIKLSCDRHLLAAAHNNINVGPVLAVLKAILVVGDATANRNPPAANKKSDGGGSGGSGGASGGGGAGGSGGGSQGGQKGGGGSELSISHILGTSDILAAGTDDLMLDLGVVDLEPVTRSAQRGTGGGGVDGAGGGAGGGGLSELALRVLSEICSQEWVLERCLQNPEELCQPDMLLDSMLSPQQAQRLLHMICYPEKSHKPEDIMDHKTIITNILENLDLWTLRMSWLDMQLMYKQFQANSSELTGWLDTVAKAAIDVFQLTGSANSTSAHVASHDLDASKAKSKSQSTWLVAPLISKLPSAVQGRVLKVAGQVLESGNWASSSGGAGSSGAAGGGGGSGSGGSGGGAIGGGGGTGGGSGRKGGGGGGGERTPQHHGHHHHQLGGAAGLGSSLTGVGGGVGSGGALAGGASRRYTPPLSHHQPFLSLVLTCLKGQDDQREGLLVSLHSQLSQCLSLSKDDRVSNYESPKGRAMMQDALLLRFSLVGGMFDTIQRSTTLTTDWAILLAQLITYGLIDLNNNSELFTIVIDMLSTLVHSTLVSDSQSDKTDENRKHYQNLMKKLKKELGDRTSPSIQHLRQLLPLPKQLVEVIACEQMGLLHDMKGNKIAFDSTDKQGLQVSEKQRVSPWDVLEGSKNPAPLSWAWFGAVRMERKPLWYEENHRLLKYHTHSLVKPSSYFLEPIPLPPEDLDPPQEKPMKGGPVGGGPMGAVGGVPGGPMGGAMGAGGPMAVQQLGMGGLGPPMGGPPTPNSVEQSPRGTKRGAGGVKGATAAQRRKKQAKPAVQQQPQPTVPQHMGGVGPPPHGVPTHPGQQVQMGQGQVPPGYGGPGGPPGGPMVPGGGSQGGPPGMFGPPGGAVGGQWGGAPPGSYGGPQMAGGPQQQQQQQHASAYYQQQLPPGGAGRMVAGMGVGGGGMGGVGVNQQSKQALSNMLRMRIPTNPTPAPPPPPPNYAPQPPQGQQQFATMPRQQFIRQQLRAQQGMGGGMGGPTSQQSQMFQQPPGGQMYTMQQQQEMMSKYGGGAGGGAGVGGGGGNPYAGGGGGGFPGAAAGGPGGQQQFNMRQQQQQADYMQQQQQQQQQRVRQQPYMQQTPNVTMGGMGGGMVGGAGQQGGPPQGPPQGPAPPYSRGGGGGGVPPQQQPQQQQQQTSQQQFQQQMNQQRLNASVRHQLMQMQQQQQQQQQQQSPQLVAQLHRQMQHQQQQQQPGGNPQQQQQQPGPGGHPYGGHQPPAY